MAARLGKKFELSYTATHVAALFLLMHAWPVAHAGLQPLTVAVQTPVTPPVVVRHAWPAVQKAG